MRSHLILFCTYAVLTSCAPNPGGYSQHEYQFQRASSSYRNNELQHQNAEMGRYSRVEDPDKLPAPQESSQYRQSEYHAPGSEDTDQEDSGASRNLGVKGFKPRAQMNHWNSGSQLYGGQTQDSIHGRYYQTNDFQTGYVPSSRHYAHGFHEGNYDNQGNHELHGNHHRLHGLNSYSQTQTQSEYTGSTASSATETAQNTDKTKDETLTTSHQSNDFQTGYIPSTRYRGHHPHGFHQENYGHHGHHEHHGNHHRHHGLNSFSQTQTQSGSTASSVTSTDGTLIRLDDTPFDYSKFKEHGFGKDYLENTEGQTLMVSSTGPTSLTPITLLSSSSRPTMVVAANTKPLYENIGSGREYWEKTEGQTYYTSTNAGPTTSHQSIKPVYEIPEPTISIPFSQNNNEDNLRTAFTRIDQISAMQGGRSLTRNTGVGMEQGTYQNKDDTQQTMDFSGADCDYGLHTQTQTGFNQFQPQSQMQGGVTHQFKENVATTPIYNAFDQQNEDLTQQTQNFGSLGFADQETVNHQNTFTGQTQEDLSQTQDNFGKLEFGSQHKKESTTEEMTQQTQDIFGKFEFANQGQEDLSQHTQTAFTDYGFTDQNEDMKQQKFDVQNQKDSKEDMVQQTQYGFGNFEFGSQNKEGMTQQKASEEDLTQMTQQSQDAFGKFEFANQHQEDTKKNNTHEDNEYAKEYLNQMTQRSEGKFEFANQQEDLTQKTEQMTQQFDNFGAYNQKHEQSDDLTQHTQDAFANFDQSHDDLNQKQDSTFSDYSQQTQHGYGQLESGSQHQGTENIFNKNQEQQEEYGQFEFGGQQQEDLTQKNENLGGFYISSNIPQSSTGTYNNYGRSIASSSGSYGSSGSYSSQSQFQRSSSSSSSSSSGYSRSSSASSTGSGQINYGSVRRIPNEETADDLHQNKEEQFASEVHDVSQQVQKVQDPNLEVQKEDLEDSNHKTGQEILSQTHIDPEEGIVEEHSSEKPGFWKRLGGSITSTYESAKEKTKNLADKVKHNLG